MARQEETVQIDDHKYLFTQLNPKRAAKIYTFLVSRIGSTAGKAIGALKGGKGLTDADVDMGDLGEALNSLFLSLDDDRVIDHADTLLSCVLYNGQPMSLEHLNFQGRMLHKTKVVKRSLEVNFSDFLEGSDGMVAKLKAMVSMIQEKQTSSGLSGDQSSKE